MTSLPELIHYSKAPIDARDVKKRKQRKEPHPLKYDMKPSGLWVSADENGEGWGWPAWCAAETFNLDNFVHATRLTISDSRRILWILDLAEFRRFHDKYSGPLYPGAGVRSQGIDWETVASRYAGIVIAPYIWSERLGKAFWYYTWDCASGCIWDPSVVASFDPLDPLTLPQLDAVRAALSKEIVTT